MSSFPNRSSAWSMVALTSASCVTSASWYTAAFPSFSARALPLSRERPVSNTSAPSATNSSAVAAPIPLVPPVITATFPDKRPTTPCSLLKWARILASPYPLKGYARVAFHESNDEPRLMQRALSCEATTVKGNKRRYADCAGLLLKDALSRK